MLQRIKSIAAVGAFTAAYVGSITYPVYHFTQHHKKLGTKKFDHIMTGTQFFVVAKG